MNHPESFPLVSILINNYNYGVYLADAIDSALNQTYPNIEVIVVDDGSTDHSREIIERYENRITPIFKQNGGQASAFNTGFLVSRGDIICFLDADDIFKTNKLAEIVLIFQKYLDVGWCFHPLQYIGHNAEKYTETYTGESGKYDLRLDMEKGKLRGKLPFQGTATSGLCFRRSLLEKILPMPEEIRITSDDYLKYVALGISSGFVVLKTLAQQRVHENNAYTFRPDMLKLRAKVQILTSYWMKENFPGLFKFSNSIFALGASMYWLIGETELECKQLMKEYLSTASFPEQVEIHSRVLYHRLKWLIGI